MVTRNEKKSYNFTSLQGFLELGIHIGDLGCLEYIFYEKSRFFEKTFFFHIEKKSQTFFSAKNLENFRNFNENQKFS